MKRGLTLVVGVPVMAVLVLLGPGGPGGLRSSGQASAATITRADVPAARAIRGVPTPKGKPKLDATFTGSQLNTKIWDTCYPKLARYGGGCRNWGNPEESEWYQPSQVSVSGGDLHLTAKRETTSGFTANGTPETYACRSGMVTSYPGLKFEYGFVQVVANLPHANGLWPALWLAAVNGKYPPEMDMVESWGVNVLTGTFFHPVTGRHSRVTYSPRLTRGWQTYSMSWTRSRLAFYVGRRLVLTVTKNVPRQRMYFLADLAEYQAAKRGYCGGQLLIRSVKIWTS